MARFFKKINAIVWVRLLLVWLVTSVSSLAWAAPVVTATTTFVPADPTRSYLDVGQVWDGSQQVGTTTGDVIRLTLANAAGADPATDVQISVTLPNHFSYVDESGDTAVLSASGPGCGLIQPFINPGATSQAGNILSIGFFLPYTLPANCTLQLEYGVRVESTGLAGTSLISAQYSSNELAPKTSQKALLVQAPDVVITKTLTNPADGDAAIGDVVDFQISVQGSGLGGSFDVLIEDTLGAGLAPAGTFLTELSRSPGVPPPTSTANSFSYAYLPAGGKVILQASANVNSCEDLENTAAVNHLVEPTAETSLDSVEIDLTQPMIEMRSGAGGVDGPGPPDFDLLFGTPSSGTATLNLHNIGAGVVRSVTVDTNFDQIPGLSVSLVGSPNWTLNAGMLTYSGPDIAPGQDLDINFSYEISGCPPVTENASLSWLLRYNNACGDTFTPAPEFSALSVDQSPQLNFGKTASDATPRTGDTGSYTLSLNGSNVGNLPQNGGFAREVMITDVIPDGLTGVSINPLNIPFGTAVFVNGAVYLGTPLSPGDVITWEIDQSDIPSGAPLELVIDYTVGAEDGVCVAGFPIVNQADLAYDGCALDDSASASILVDEGTLNLNNDLQVVSLPGDGVFETGLNDSDQIANNELGEGEAITYQASYDFQSFSAVWETSTLTAQLGVDETTPMATQVVSGLGGPNPQVFFDLDSTGFVQVPAACLSTNGSGAMVIDLGFVDGSSACSAGFIADPELDGHSLDIRYTTTVRDADLNGGATRSFNERVIIEIAGLPDGCGADDTVTDVVTVNLARASLSINASLGGGSPVQVCDVYPLTVSVPGPNGQLRADNLLFEFDTDFWRFVDAAGNLVSAGSEDANVSYAGGLANLTVDAALTNAPVGLPPGGQSQALQFAVTPQTALYSAPNNDGSVSFNVLLDPTVVSAPAGATNLLVGVAYDDHQTTASLEPLDRDFSAVGTTGIGFLAYPELVLQVTPDNKFVRGTQVSFRIYVTNTGSGTSFNTQVRNVFPDAFNPNAALSDPNPDGGGPPTVVNQGGPGQSELIWQVGEIAAGETIQLRAVADLRGTKAAPVCQFNQPTDNVAEATYGCGGVTSSVFDDAGPRFQQAPADLQVLHDTTNAAVQLCGASTIDLVVKNTGNATNYDITINEQLGAFGLTYVPGSTTVSYQNGAFVPAPDPLVFAGQLSWVGDRNSADALLGAGRLGSLAPLEQLRIRFSLESPGETLNTFDDITLSAQADYYLGCGDNVAASSNGSLFTIPLHKPSIRVDKTGWNDSGGQSEADASNTVFGGVNDTLVWRIEVENEGDADAESSFLHDLLGAGGDFQFVDICEGTGGAVYLNCLSGGGAGGFVPFSGASPNGNEEQYSPVADLAAGETRIFYLRGTVEDCVNATNSGDFEWGCPLNPPDGGLDSPVDNTDTAFMRTAASSALSVSSSVFSPNGAGLPSTNGEVVVDVSNLNAGNVRAISVDDLLPVGYIYDASFTPTVVVTGPGAALAGTVDTATADATDPARPIFALTSSVAGPSVEQSDLLRNGDTARLRFRIVQNAEFDLTEDPNVRQETLGNNLDPAGIADTVNSVTVSYESSCGVAQTPVSIAPAVTPRTPDLDIDVVNNINRIVNNVGDTQNFVFRVRNRGDAVADNAQVVIEVGAGWTFPAAVANCTLAAGPRTITCPIDGTTTLAAGGIRNINLTNLTVANETGSLRLFGTVEGNIELQDASDTGNDYSLDTIQARTVGYRQTKTLLSTSEAGPDDSTADSVQIGEEATYEVNAVFFGTGTELLSNVLVSDLLPGPAPAPTMGYVANAVTASPASVSGTTAPAQVVSGEVEWALEDFDTDGAAQVFTATVTARVFNEPLTEAAPNQNGVVLTNSSTAEWEYLSADFDENSPGFPVLVNRQETVTISTPSVTMTKQVCNETALGATAPCDLSSEFTDTAGGDAGDLLVYRITLSNAASRATAFDFEVIDTASSKLVITPFAADGIDNDGDGITDGGDPEGLLAGSTITFNEANTGATLLGALPAGQSVVLSYSATVQNNVFPGELLTNNVVSEFDTLDGATGGQADAQGANNTATGSRSYSLADSVDVAVFPVEQSKLLTLTSVGADTDPNLVVGEQAQFQLAFTLPEGQVNAFRVLDAIPNNLDLVIANTAAPDIVVGDSINCVANPPARLPLVLPANGGAGDLTLSYNFGNCTVLGPNRQISILYTTQVRNIAANVDGAVFENNASYQFIDGLLNTVDGPFVPVELTIVEPELVLTKSISPNSGGDNTDELDAGDVVTVQLSVENTGNAPAYNVSVTDLLNDNQVNDNSNPDQNVNTSVAINNALRDIEVYNCAAGVTPIATPVDFTPSFDNGDGDQDGGDEAADCLVSYLDSSTAGLLPAEGVVNFSFDVALADALVILGDTDDDYRNTARVTATSLPNGVVSSGDTDYDRTAAVDPSNNDRYEAANSFFLNVDRNEVSKQHTASSDSNTPLPDNNSGDQVAVGETYTSTLTFDIKEGTTLGAELSDSLSLLSSDSGPAIAAADVSLVAATLDKSTAALSSSINPASINTAGPVDVLLLMTRAVSGSAVDYTLALGDVVNSTASDQAAGSEEYVLTLTYRVNDNTATRDGRFIQNIPLLDHQAPSGTAINVEGNTKQVGLVEPVLDITKTHDDADGLIFAGETANYLITACNTGNGPAYDVQISDVIPAGLRGAGLSAVSYEIGNVAAAVNLTQDYDVTSGEVTWKFVNGEASHVLLPTNPDTCLEISYSVTADADLAAGVELANLANVEVYYSQPIGVEQARPYPSVGPAIALLSSPGIRWRPDHQSTVEACSPIQYQHLIDVFPGDGQGQLVFEISQSSAGFLWAMYLDSNANQSLDSGDTLLTPDGVSSITPNFKQALVFVVVTVPCEAPDGLIDTTSFGIRYTVAGVDFNASVTDITRVQAVGEGSLSAFKEMAIDTDCNGTADTPFTVTAQAQPDQCVVYRVRFVNDGVGLLTNVQVHDTVPSFTSYEAGTAVFESTPAGLQNGTVTEPGSDGILNWDYINNPGLSAGDEGSVRYNVRVLND